MLVHPAGRWTKQMVYQSVTRRHLRKKLKVGQISVHNGLPGEWDACVQGYVTSASAPLESLANNLREEEIRSMKVCEEGALPPLSFLELHAILACWVC